MQTRSGTSPATAAHPVHVVAVVSWHTCTVVKTQTADDCVGIFIRGLALGFSYMVCLSWLRSLRLRHQHGNSSVRPKSCWLATTHQARGWCGSGQPEAGRTSSKHVLSPRPAHSTRGLQAAPSFVFHTGLCREVQAARLPDPVVPASAHSSRQQTSGGRARARAYFEEMMPCRPTLACKFINAVLGRGKSNKQRNARTRRGPRGSVCQPNAHRGPEATCESVHGSCVLSLTFPGCLPTR